VKAVGSRQLVVSQQFFSKKVLVMPAPSPPSIVIRPVASPNTLEFYWEEPKNKGGFAISSYNVWCSAASLSTSVDASTYYYVFNGLTNKRDYTFQIQASNKAGYSEYIPFRTVQPGSLPSLPTNVTANVVYPSGARITWEFSTLTETEAQIHWFLITLFNENHSTITEKSTHATERARGFVNLPNGNYTVLVQAISDAGYSFPNSSTFMTIAA
jgi:hypothetical protein